MAIRVRELTAEEKTSLESLAHSRTAAGRAVERARMVWYAHEGQRVPAIATRLDVTEQTVRLWLKRFNAAGLAGLKDAERSGRLATYTPEQVADVIVTSFTKPETLDLPFASWTLERLAAYLNEVKGIGMKRSRIDELLIAEGLRWAQQETWFGERVDPAFAEKRGPSSGSTPPHPREA